MADNQRDKDGVAIWYPINTHKSDIHVCQLGR